MWTLCKELNGAQPVDEEDYLARGKVGSEFAAAKADLWHGLLRFGRT
jgi:hypothetical protein